jgi:exodeoxyribonuclease V alpha subunit
MRTTTTRTASAADRMVDTLADLAARGRLDPYDVALARLVLEMDARAGCTLQPLVAVLAALASQRTREGDVCLVLADVAGLSLFDDALALPAVDVLRKALLASSCVARTDDAATPLVLDDAGRLYLRRYHRYERTLADALLALATDPPEVDDAALRDAIRRRFGSAAAQPDGQRVAAATAVLRRFAVITGGPGTGKTTTVARVLALLHDLHGPAYRVLLAAPTGKAATRLQTSIRRTIERESLPFAPPVVQTVHRMLGPVAGSIRFRHDVGNPLPADCVVVDEASMIDLALAAKLVRALGPRTRLILLGDRDQLASVEAGAVFHGICDGPAAGTPSSIARIAAVTETPAKALPPARKDAPVLADAIARLTHSHRFDAGGGIGALAAAIRAGDAAAARRSLDGNTAVRRLAAAPDALLATMQDGYADFVAAVRSGAGPLDVLAAADRFRTLAAMRAGPVGTEALNAGFERGLRRALGVADREAWYAGRLVMITANDYAARLFNGDVGVALPAGDTLRVFFAPAAEGEPPRSFAPGLLPACESAFAMTIHKSQGSEFARVLVVLPPAASPLATRELLYTAVTRAAEAVDLAGDDPMLAMCVERTQSRRSGLADALWAR